MKGITPWLSLWESCRRRRLRGHCILVSPLRPRCARPPLPKGEARGAYKKQTQQVFLLCLLTAWRRHLRRLIFKGVDFAGGFHGEVGAENILSHGSKGRTVGGLFAVDGYGDLRVFHGGEADERAMVRAARRSAEQYRSCRTPRRGRCPDPWGRRSGNGRYPRLPR